MSTHDHDTKRLARTEHTAPDLISEEQRQLDAALDAVRAALSPSTSAAAGAADEYAAQALARMRHERTLVLERASKAPLFGMIEDDHGSQVRLGPASLWSPSNALVVSNWRADAAEPFYVAQPDDRHGQRLRRRIQVRDGQVLTVEEQRLDDRNGPDQFRAAAAAAAADTRAGRMAEIAATIQPDQYEVISASDDGVLGVQGGPGTGKTAVALHRAAWLLYRHERVRAGGVLFVGPGKLFLDFVSGVLPALGEDAVDQQTARGVLADGRLREDEPERARLKGDLRVAELIRRALDQRIAPRGPSAIALKVGPVQVEIARDDVAAALQAARGRRAPVAGQRSHFLRELASRARPAGGRVRLVVTGLEQALATHPDFQRAAERLWPRLSPRQLVTDLLTSRKRLRAAGAGRFSEAELDLLHLPGISKLEDKRWTEADLPLLDEARSLLTGVPATYAHVIVDEAQDLSPMQLHCVGRRARRRSLTLAGDIAQRKRLWHYADWDELFAAVGDPGARLMPLRVSYRVPTEVLALAGGLLPRVAPGLQMPEGVRSAEEPLLVGTVPNPRLPLAVLGVIDHFAPRPGQLALIGHATSLGTLLSAARESCAEASRTDLTAPVVVLTVDEIAGLEFDSVLVYRPDQILSDGPHGPARLLVALTRAVKRLAVFGPSLPPELEHAAMALGPRCVSDVPLGSHELTRATRARQRPATKPKRAAQLGLTREVIGELGGRVRVARPTPELVEEIAAWLAGPSGLTEKRSTFTRRDVLQALCEVLPASASLRATDVERLADEFLRSPLAVSVVAGERREVLELDDGRAIGTVAAERIYSTPELLALERAILEFAVARRGAHMALARPQAVERALARRPTLVDEQREMVRRLTRDGDGVALVLGPAGSGKTFALGAAREAWQTSGRRVYGVAVARRAARELEEGAGIPSTSVASLLHALERHPLSTLRPRSVLVVDEAGMLPTRELAKLVERVRGLDVKLVLVGDHRQLAAIGPGGAFRALMERLPVIALEQNRRQVAEWERDALRLVREGAAPEAVQRYDDAGRIVVGEDADVLRQRLVADWWAARDLDGAVMIAERRVHVDDLNGRAHALMRAAGALGAEEATVAGASFSVGDRVVVRRNDPRLGVVNGDRGAVVAVDPARGRIDLELPGGKVSLPREYLERPTRHGRPALEHGYAITAHLAQGMTCRRTFILATDSLTREAGYVALSRGKESNRIYAIAPAAPERDEFAPATRERREARAMLVQGLQRSNAQTLATDATVASMIEVTQQHRTLEGTLSQLRAGRRRLERERPAWYRPGARSQHVAALADLDVRVRKVERDVAQLVGRQEALRAQVRRDASARQREPERPFTRERDLGIDLGR